MAIMARMLLRNTLSTWSRSISAKSSHMTCLEALLIKQSILPYLQLHINIRAESLSLLFL